jgi:hypothetical protein
MPPKRSTRPQELSHAQLAECYRAAFGDDSGAVVLDDLRRRYGMRVSFRPDPYETAFHEGQRSVYLFICSMLDPRHEEEEIQHA